MFLTEIKCRGAVSSSSDCEYRFVINSTVGTEVLVFLTVDHLFRWWIALGSKYRVDRLDKVSESADRSATFGSALLTRHKNPKLDPK